MIFNRSMILAACAALAGPAMMVPSMTRPESRRHKRRTHKPAQKRKDERANKRFKLKGLRP